MAARRVEIGGKLYTIVDSDHSELSHAVYLAHSVEYCMTGAMETTDDPSILSRVTGKVLYLYDAITEEVSMYNYNEGIGCVVCYKDVNSKWWVVATPTYNGDLNTVFPKDGNMIAHIASLVVSEF